MPRVMTTCPDTGEAIPTQLSMDAATFGAIGIEGFTVACGRCGREHPWDSESAWVAGALPQGEPPPGQRRGPPPRRRR